MTILLISFFYTEKSVSVVKEYDEIMVKIKNIKVENEIVDSIVENDTIIPGISGKKIDVNKSYSNMKRYGKFDESLLVYKNILPTDKLSNNLDKKIISGNPKKRMVSLIFVVEDDIENLIEILNKNNVRANFFITNKYFKKNEKTVLKIIEKKHNIGIIDKTQESFNIINNYVKKVGGQANSYCYYTNKEFLNICKNSKSYTIKPNIIIDTNPYKNIVEKLKPGAIIELKINDTLIKELNNIIKYINQKGFKIETLENHLSEDYIK